MKFQGACVYWSTDTSRTQNKSDHGLTLVNVGHGDVALSVVVWMDTGMKFQGACVYWSTDTSLTQKPDHGLTSKSRSW